MLINFANPDMVGHTGVIPAAVEAVEVADACLGRVLAAVEAAGGIMLVTADHGNAEEMLAADGSPQTAHTTNPVPLVVTKRGRDAAQRRPLGRHRSDRAEPFGVEIPGLDDRSIADRVSSGL